MSVLIKGMKMPHYCFECPLSIPPISDDIPTWLCGGNGMKVHEANTEEHRPFGCPLVEVSEDAVSPCEVCPIVKEMNENVDELVGELYGEDGSLKPRYCDRNTCASNEYNGKGCEDCYIAQNYNLEDGDSPCIHCGEE